MFELAAINPPPGEKATSDTCPSPSIFTWVSEIAFSGVILLRDKDGIFNTGDGVLVETSGGFMVGEAEIAVLITFGDTSGVIVAGISGFTETQEVIKLKMIGARINDRWYPISPIKP
jgi:hypothetical protein